MSSLLMRSAIFFLTYFLLAASCKPQKVETGSRSSMDFAPGYPLYSVSSNEQLGFFPLPRFREGHRLHRNFSWFDFKYMSFDFSVALANTKGALSYKGWGKEAHLDKAVALDSEMAKNWNYYFNIPSPTYGGANFSKPGTLHGKFADFANKHPEVPVCTYIFWGGVRPKNAGFANAKGPYIRTFEAIDPCLDTSYPLIARDGITQRKYLNELISCLPNRPAERKIDFVNENGEVFGPVWTPNGEGYRGNPKIACIQNDSSDARAQRGKWQFNVFNTYKKQFISNDSVPGLKNTEFSFYQISGFLPDYYGDYSQLRTLNQAYGGAYYSTPDFYPGDNLHGIYDRYAANHGLDCIAEGREWEIELGDTYFSPFICAGWFADSLNYRPAPWLASLKALSLMGAEFYYPAYFNVGNPSSRRPENSAGWIYQVAMPVYAQAITSRFETIFFNSKKFHYEKDGDFLCVYRESLKDPGLFVINADWFSDKTGNNTDNISEKNNVRIGGDRLKINFRRQGSVYIYDRRKPSQPVFYQLDGWHESTHPYYWSRDFLLEAELHDDSADFSFTTELPEKRAGNDFTSFTTFVSFSENNVKKPLGFNFSPREKDSAGYFVWIRARSANKSSLKIRANGNPLGEVKGISAGDFKWYLIEKKGKATMLSAEKNKTNLLELFADDVNLQVDKILLSNSAKPPRENY
jgi:hypothetical protein